MGDYASFLPVKYGPL